MHISDVGNGEGGSRGKTDGITSEKLRIVIEEYPTDAVAGRVVMEVA